MNRRGLFRALGALALAPFATKIVIDSAAEVAAAPLMICEMPDGAYRVRIDVDGRVTGVALCDYTENTHHRYERLEFDLGKYEVHQVVEGTRFPA